MRPRRLVLRLPSLLLRWHVVATGLVAAPDVAIDLGHPRPSPPTLYQQQWGGPSCRLRPIFCRLERLRSVAPLFLPPPNPSSLIIALATLRQPGGEMISSAATTNYRGSVHDGGHMPVVFVGVTALVLPTQRDHSADADIGLGLLVPHPRPFRWWILAVVDCHMVCACGYGRCAI